DTFKFSNGTRIAGYIDGGGLPGNNDTLDWSSYTTARSVFINNPVATHGFSGQEAGPPSSLGAFKNIDRIIGSNTATPNQILGPSLNSTWHITSPFQGTLTASQTQLTFSNFQNLYSGGGIDTIIGPNLANEWMIFTHNGGILKSSGNTMLFMG